MRAFVTGATGFIGSHLVRRLLRDGHAVSALVRPGSDIRRIADVREAVEIVGEDLASPRLAERLKEVRPDVCFHLAWYAVPGLYLDAPENLLHLELSLRLIRGIQEAGCRRVVGVGTCLEYELGARPVSEESPTRPARPYAAAKLALATVFSRLREATGLSSAWARLFYVYGPQEEPRRLVPSVIRSLLAGDAAQVTTGAQVRDYLHVEDVCAALEAIGTATIEGPVNVGSGQPVTVKQVVLTLAGLMGAGDRVAFGAVAADSREPAFVCADIRRLVLVVGFLPQIGLDQGLGRTVDWWIRELQPAGGGLPTAR